MKKKIWEMKFYFIPAIAIAIVMLVLPLYIFKQYPKSALLYSYIGLMSFLIFLRTKDDWNNLIRTNKSFDKVVTLMIWIVSGPLIVFLGIVSIITINIFKKSVYLVGYHLSLIVVFLLGVRLRTIGELPEGQFIVISNHGSWLDDAFNCIIMKKSKWKVVFAPEVKRIFGAKQFLKHIGIPLNRKEMSSRLTVTRKMLRWIDKGYSLRIYPEGKRLPLDMKDEYLCDFDNGAFLLSKLSGKKIVPVVISWTFLFKPRSGQWWYSPQTITFIFLDPVEILPEEDVDGFNIRVKDIVLSTLKNHVETGA